MEEISKLQEEFEALIDQLERLKSVHALTAENAESARRSIEEMQAMVVAFDNFKKKVVQDYAKKGDMLTKLHDAFKESLDSLEGTITKQAGRFEKLASESNTKATKVIEAFRTESTEQQEEFKKSLSELVEHQTQALEEKLSKLEASSKASSDKIGNELNRMKDEAKRINDAQQAESTLLKEDIQSQFSTMKNWLMAIMAILVLLGLKTFF